MKWVQQIKDLPPVRQKIIGGAFLFLLAVLVYPFQTTVVPAWNLQVVDEQGRKVSGINVTQHWQHHSLESAGQEELQKTGEQGEVTFPARKIRASLLTRAFAPTLKLLRNGGSAKLGAYASVVVWGSKDNETNVAVYNVGEPPPPQIVAARLK